MPKRRVSTRQSSSRQSPKQRPHSRQQLPRRSLRIKSKTAKALPAFQYQPLTGRKIRILHLAPGRTGDELVGDLAVGNLDSKKCKYDALSYMWGDPEPVATIRIGHQMLPIAHNLNDALQRLRYRDKTLVIWVDAICINQDDDNEKATQVPLMRQLYSNAKMVRIWINELLGAPPGVIKALQTYQYTKDSDNLYGLGHDPIFYETVLPLFLNPYWSRVWVQQEVVNAKDMAIHCVNADFNGEDIVEFCHSIERAAEHILGYQPLEAYRWLELIHIYSTPAGGLLRRKYDTRRLRLIWVLLDFSGSGLESSRECDYLYALMHMAEEYEEGAICVDYSKSRFEVMLDAAEYHVRRNQDVEFLSLAYMTKGPGQQYNQMFPTWIPPRWLLSKEKIPMVMHGFPKCLWGDYQPSASICIKSRRLNLRGLRIDYISQCLTPDWNSAGFTVRDLLESPFGAVLLSTYSSELIAEVFELFESVSSSNSSVEVLVEGLSLLRASAEEAPYTHMHFEDLNRVVSKNLEPHQTSVLQWVFYIITNHTMVKTASGKLCKIPRCDFKVGDEIWVVPGCSLCVVLRQQPDGTYWHICAAVIPNWQKFEAFREFTESSAPGDRIGDWTAEEIQIS